MFGRSPQLVVKGKSEASDLLYSNIKDQIENRVTSSVRKCSLPLATVSDEQHEGDKEVYYLHISTRTVRKSFYYEIMGKYEYQC